MPTVFVVDLPVLLRIRHEMKNVIFWNRTILRFKTKTMMKRSRTPLIKADFFFQIESFLPPRDGNHSKDYNEDIIALGMFKLCIISTIYL